MNLSLPSPSWRPVLAAVLALGLAANAVFMLAAPGPWYRAVPGVTPTGPFNLHFIHDIGMAYLTAALGLAWRAVQPRAWPAAVMAAGFLALHAGVHLADLWTGRCGWQTTLEAAPGVMLPALLALFASWPPHPVQPPSATPSAAPPRRPSRH